MHKRIAQVLKTENYVTINQKISMHEMTLNCVDGS